MIISKTRILKKDSWPVFWVFKILRIILAPDIVIVNLNLISNATYPTIPSVRQSNCV